MRPYLVLALLVVPIVSFEADAGSADYLIGARNTYWDPSVRAVLPGQLVYFYNYAGDHAFQRDDMTDTCKLPCYRSFDEIGVVPYHCAYHPSMKAKIVVREPAQVDVLSPVPGSTVSGVTELVFRTEPARYVTLYVHDHHQSATQAPDGTWRATIDTAPLPLGPFDLPMRVTTLDNVTHTVTTSFVVANEPRVDIGIRSFRGDPDGARWSTLELQLENVGNVPVDDAEFLLEYRDGALWRPIGTIVVDLPAASTRSWAYDWEPGVAVGGFTVRATTDPQGRLPDGSASNDVRYANTAFWTAAVPGVIVPSP